MKKLLLLALLAFHCIGAFAQEKPTLVDTISQVPSHTIAVYASGVEGCPSLHPVTSQIIQSLNVNYQVVNRDDEFLKYRDDEFAYIASGKVNDEQLARIGEDSGVDFICALVVQKFGSEYYYQTRIINVETADIVSLADASSSDFSIAGLRAVGQKLASGLNDKKDVTQTPEKKDTLIVEVERTKTVTYEFYYKGKKIDEKMRRKFKRRYR